MLELGVVITFICIIAIILKLYTLSVRSNFRSPNEPTTMVSVDLIKDLFKSNLMNKWKLTDDIKLKTEYFSCINDSTILLDQISKNLTAEHYVENSNTVDNKVEEEKSKPKLTLE